ncbi:MAG: transcription termination/antitermination protein NusA [Clostridiales bacterium]|nr:transcription termination/antitermination protein NusA [Clostridiales bacterium]
MTNQKVDLMEAISMLAREKDMNEEVLVDTIEEALKAAYRRNNRQASPPVSNLTVRLSKKDGARVYLRKLVAETVEEPDMQISLEEALKIRPEFHVGDIVEIDVTPENFGRVAAQTAKQLLVQRIREAERGKIYDEYIEKENEILTAIVQRVEPKAVYLELGRTEGIMESNEFIPGETYREGDHIKVYVLKVRRSGSDFMRNPQVYVSRIHPGLVKRLFEMEVPEIATGVVQIRSISREAGSRTKIAVTSIDPMIDPVGACVGPRGSRVEKVVNELKNEKIDIIKWSSDPAEFVANALNPAHVVSVFISDAEKICRVIVPDMQLSLAIGKEGQNARLAAKLTGWKIDIKSQTQMEELMREQSLRDAQALEEYEQGDYGDTPEGD